MLTEPTKSKRRFERIPTPKGLWVAWQHNANQNVSRVRDLNFGGLFIATTTPAPPDATIQILLTVPEGEIRALAVVRNITPGDGMGVEFKDLTPQAADRVEKLVTRLLRSSPSETT